MGYEVCCENGDVIARFSLRYNKDTDTFNGVGQNLFRQGAKEVTFVTSFDHKYIEDELYKEACRFLGGLNSSICYISAF